MRVFLEIYNDYDLFYFSNDVNHQSATIEVSNLNSSQNFVNFFQASLQKNKIVIVTRNRNIVMPDLVQLKSSHFKIESNEFLFLNFTLKNKIKEFRINQDSINNFQELESFLQANLSDIF